MTQVDDFTFFFIWIIILFVLPSEQKVYNELVNNILKTLNIVRIISCIVFTILITELAIPKDEFTCDNHGYAYCHDYKHIGNATVVENDLVNSIYATYGDYKCSVHHLDDITKYPVGTIFDAFRNARGNTVCVTTSYVYDYIKNKNYYNTINYKLITGLALYIGFTLATLLLVYIVINIINSFGYNIIVLNNNIFTSSTTNSPFHRTNNTPIYDENSSPNIIVINNNNDCSVCQDTLFNGTNICVPKCRHLLHKKCYDDCVKGGHTKCPECRVLMI